MPEQSYTPKINLFTLWHTWSHLCMLGVIKQCMCMHLFLRQKIEDLERERQRLEEQNNILEMRLERHNLQVGALSSLQLFSVMDLLVWHKGTNLITPRAADEPAWHYRLIHTNVSHIWQFFKHNWTQVWLEQHPMEKSHNLWLIWNPSFVGGKDYNTQSISWTSLVLAVNDTG